jgi:NAD(P)-dependent dehydrogenase (short-subunit alcohol dehydrogenase family)
VTAVAVITGTTHGIGRVTALELARAGYSVAMLCRDVPAAEIVRAEIGAEVPQADVRVIPCDLASLQSVRRCAQIVRNEFGPVTVLINNAGLVSSRHRMSADGFELTFAVNHLGHFLLMRLLLDRMARHGRIVNVASRAHFRARPESMDLQTITDPQARYGSIQAYTRSKLANVMFTFALARRLAGTGITTNCLHPGVVATHLLPVWVRAIKPLITRVIFDPDRGARTTLHVALSPEVAEVSGAYFDEYQQIQQASPLANDVERQEALWLASEHWTGAGAWVQPKAAAGLRRVAQIA